MIIKVKSNSYFIFDLDDTLFSEIEFLRSGYKFIAEKLPDKQPPFIYQKMLEKYSQGENVFQWLADKYKEKSLTVQDLLMGYRTHQPSISLKTGTKNLLDALKMEGVPCGIITDGRSITQRNKLKALGLDTYFTDIIISEEFGSEKPDPKNFLYFEKKYPGSDFFFFGDNTQKDFLIPRKLGWRIFCIKDDGLNIHPQDMEGFDNSEIIASLEEIQIEK